MYIVINVRDYGKAIKHLRRAAELSDDPHVVAEVAEAVKALDNATRDQLNDYRKTLGRELAEDVWGEWE